MRTPSTDSQGSQRASHSDTSAEKYRTRKAGAVGMSMMQNGAESSRRKESPKHIMPCEAQNSKLQAERRVNQGEHGGSLRSTGPDRTAARQDKARDPAPGFLKDNPTSHGQRPFAKCHSCYMLSSVRAAFCNTEHHQLGRA